MVGGTFGVAVLGALVATLGRSKLDELLPAVPASTRAQIASSLGSGGGSQAGAPAQIVDAAHQSFVYALQNGLRLGSAVALAGALIAFALVGRDRADTSAAPVQPGGPSAPGVETIEPVAVREPIQV
jgi:hypothetical protein